MINEDLHQKIKKLPQDYAYLANYLLAQVSKGKPQESGCTLRLSHGVLSVRSPDASGFVGTGEVLYRPGAGMGGYAGVPPVEKTDRRRKLKLI